MLEERRTKGDVPSPTGHHLCNGGTYARKRSIRRRLHRLVVLSVGLALICSAILSVWQMTTSYLSDKRESLMATANVIASVSSRAVASGDKRQIRDSLRPIARLQGMAYARIEDGNGRPIAQVGSAVRLSSELALDDARRDSLFAFLRTRTVQVSAPIIFGGETHGRVVLVSQTGDLASRFLGVFIIASFGGLLAMGVGLLIASRLQRSITLPLSLLSGEMARISQTHDYSAVVPAAADLETEQLASSFNDMMSEITTTSLALSNREAELMLRLSRATEKRDNETGGHILRMAEMCRLVAEGLGLGKNEVEAIHRVAPLHDVGKISVPDAIMFKPGKLDPAERREIEKHTTNGYEILRDSESELIRKAAEMAWSHHERWDGAGYPRGLQGTEIPLTGRVAAVADVFDALASERPYKPAWSLAAVQAYLIEKSGAQFDPACVEGLLSRWEEVEKLYADREAEAAPLQMVS